MERNNLIRQILSLKGEQSDNWDLYEKYSTSDLKRILNDLLTVRVNVGVSNSVMRTVAVAGVFVVFGLIIVFKI